MSRANPRYRRVNPLLPAINPAGSVITISVVGLIDAQLTINNFSYGVPVVPMTVSLLGAALTAWQTAFLANYRACLSNDWSMQFVKGVCDTNPSLQSAFDTTNATVLGTGGAGHEPSTVSVCITKYTATKGQHGRGRVYLPGVPTGGVTGSNITGAALIAALNTFAGNMAGTFTAGANTYTPEVRTMAKVGGVRQATGSDFIIRTQVRFLLATTRRRRIGRGK